MVSFFPNKKRIFKYFIWIIILLLFWLTTLNFFGLSHFGRPQPKIRLKTILFWGKFFYFNELKTHCIEDSHSMDFCPFKCEYIVDQNETSLRSSDAIIIHGREDPDVILPPFRLPHQRLVFLMLESAQHSWTNISYLNYTFNWTMTHRTESDIPFPYGSLLKKSGLSHFNTKLLLQRKLVAWAASNCNVVSSDRQALVEEISKYIQVDTYGECGLNKCPTRPISMWMCDFPQMCSELLGKSYKFYLAFENSICEDYVTEKFFNSLKFNMVPVALGPSRECYEKHVPPEAFIHVNDFATVKELADYLKYLDEHDDQYLKYFDWKNNYEIDEINYFQRGWCNLCTKLHLLEDFVDIKKESKSYPSIHQWWLYPMNKAACFITKVENGTVVKRESNSMGEMPFQ